MANEHLALEGSDYQMSLSKLLGQPIKDIGGYISMEFDVPVFKLTQIVLVDGTCIWVQGEHDIAYLPAHAMVKGLGEDYMNELFEAENPGWRETKV